MDLEATLLLGIGVVVEFLVGSPNSCTRSLGMAATPLDGMEMCLTGGGSSLMLIGLMVMSLMLIGGGNFALESLLCDASLLFGFGGSVSGSGGLYSA